MVGKEKEEVCRLMRGQVGWIGITIFSLFLLICAWAIFANPNSIFASSTATFLGLSDTTGDEKLFIHIMPAVVVLCCIIGYVKLMARG